MTLDDALSRLKFLRNDATWALNERNGAAGRQFGVKLRDIRDVAKAIKTDHALAVHLWDSGIVDARLLAILIMKPRALTTTDLDRLIRSNRFLGVSDWLNSYGLKQHPDKEILGRQWTQDPHPITARAH